MKHFRKVAVASLLLCGLGVAHRAPAQILSPLWQESEIFNDTLSVGVLRASRLVDMTNFTSANLSIEADPPKGAATPRVTLGIRLVKVYGGTLIDTTTTAVVCLQTLADRSYLSSAAGDSLAYGFAWTGSSVQLSPCELALLFQLPNSKWSYPDAIAFDLNNKGQAFTVRRWYLEIRNLTASGTDPARVIARVTLRR